ncbi:CRPV-109 [Crowpox virus]|nr:CRPV-109 [Crowpox virus]
MLNELNITLDYQDFIQIRHYESELGFFNITKHTYIT